MLQNYLKIAWRSLWKNKGYTFINVGGLAVGLACCLLIALYVFDELSYESWNPRADRTYRINSDIRYGGSDMTLATSSPPMGAAIIRDYPAVEQFVRLRKTGNWVVKSRDRQFVEHTVYYADSTFFDVFPVKVIAGNAKEALARAGTLAMSKTTALRYFSTPEAAIDQTVLLDNRQHYRITAVYEDIPANSHLNGNMLLSMADEAQSGETDNWGSHNFNTYLLLREGAGAGEFKKIFEGLHRNHISPGIQKLGITMEELEKQGSYLRYSAIPIKDIHLYSSRNNELKANGNIRYVYIFSAVALFILLIACINFMNLATAQSAGRAREVGIRKVLGSKKASLVNRFLSESVLTVVIALAVALAAVTLVLPYFGRLADKPLSLHSLLNWRFIVLAAAVPLVVGMAAGSYPAFFLSAFQPITVLKGVMRNKLSGARLRSILVVLQFTMSVILLTGTIVIYKQLHYIQHKRLGFDKEQVLIIQNSFTLATQQADALKQELQQLPGVEAVSMSGFLPVPSVRNDNPLFPGSEREHAKAVYLQNWFVDEDYLRTMKMEMTAGRFFSRQFGTDSNAVVLNEAAAKMFGFKDPVGKLVYAPQDDEWAALRPLHVIGVVRNFHFENMRQTIGPLAFFFNKPGETASRMLVRSTAAIDKQALVRHVENKWKAIVPGQPFDYSFMDSDFNNMYKADQKVGQIALLFAGLAIFVACLGLFGLVAYVVEQRTKEIGIRKVLGASAGSVVTLLSKDFIRLVLVAILLAIPLAWFLMRRWLQDYEYRIDMQWWMFLAAGGIAVVIALATVCFQSVKAALSNPVKSLKTE